MAKPLVAFCAILLAIGTSQVFSASIGTPINEDEAVALILSDKDQNVITSALIGGVLGRLASKMNIKKIEFGTPDIVVDSDAEDNTGTELKITEGKDGITMKIDGDPNDESNLEVTLHKDEDESEAEATVTADIEASGDGDGADAATTDDADTTGDSEAKGQEAADAGATIDINGGDGGVDITLTVKGDKDKAEEEKAEEEKAEEEKAEEEKAEEEKAEEEKAEEEKAEEEKAEEEKAEEEKAEEEKAEEGDENVKAGYTITVNVQNNGDAENEVDIDDEDSNNAAESLSAEIAEEVSPAKEDENSDDKDESESDSDSESDESKDRDEVKGINTLDVLSESEEDAYKNLYSQDSSSQEDSDEISLEKSEESSEESSEWPLRRPLLPLAPLPSYRPLPPLAPLPSYRPLPPHRPLSPQGPLPWWLKGLTSQKTVHHIVHHVGSPVVLGSGPYGIGLPAHHLLGANHYHSGAKLLPPSLYGAPLPTSMALPLHYLDQTWGPQSQLTLEKLLATPWKQAALEKVALAARKEALLAKAKIQKDIAADITLGLK